MNIVMIGCLCSLVGSILGGIVGIALGKKRVAFCLAFAAAVMISIVFLDIFPEIMKKPVLATIAVLVGLVLISWISQKVNVENTDEKTGLIVLIAMALHNFPEGLVLGSTAVYNYNITIVIAILMVLHDIPEGMSITTFSNKPRAWVKPIASTILASGFTILGAMVGYLLGEVSDVWIILSLGLASGAMINVAFCELLPVAYKTERKNKVFLYIVIGILISIFVTIIIGGPYE